MHFGLGGRQCIGKTIATTNIFKLTSALLQDFEFELVEPSNASHYLGKQSSRNCDSTEYILGDGKSSRTSDVPQMVSVGISDLEADLMVTCRSRHQEKV